MSYIVNRKTPSENVGSVVVADTPQLLFCKRLVDYDEVGNILEPLPVFHLELDG